MINFLCSIPIQVVSHESMLLEYHFLRVLYREMEWVFITLEGLTIMMLYGKE